MSQELPKPVGEPSEPKAFAAEIAPHDNEGVFSGILRVENNAAEEIALEEADLRAAYENPGAITVLLRNPDGDIVGFVNALPNSEVYAELHADDPEFTNDPRKAELRSKKCVF
jgi:hypothetical protein